MSTDLARRLVAGRPVREATAWAALAVAVTLVGALVVELVAPESDPLLRRLPVVLALLALSLVVAHRIGWRALAAQGPSTWRSTWLLVVPLGIALVPLAWGWSPEAGTLALLVVGYAATGAFEELWYRGVVLRAALPLGPVRGAALSAVLFGAAHLSNIAFGASAAVTAAQAVGSAAGGFGYAVLRQRTDALWALAAIHGLGDLLLHTTGLNGGALWVVLVGHDLALFAWGLVCLRGLRREAGPTAPRTSAGGAATTAATARRRSTVVASAVYVASWVAGLAVAGGTVDRSLDDDGVRAHVVGHGGAVLAQATLVHLVAGVALVVLVVGLARLVGRPALRRSLLVTGVGAGTVSVLQWVAALVLVLGAGGHESGWSSRVLDLVDGLDVVKLLLLAVAVGSAGAGAAGFPRWWQVLSALTSTLLVGGAVGLVVPASVLTMVLAASLVSLLAWAGAVPLCLRRTGGRRGSGGTAVAPVSRPVLPSRSLLHRQLPALATVGRELR